MDHANLTGHALLSALLSHPHYFAEVGSIVRKEDFATVGQAWLYDWMWQRFRNGQEIDPILALDEAQGSGHVDEVSAVLSTGTNPAMAVQYARSVQEGSARRALAKDLEKLRRKALDNSNNPHEIAAEMSRVAQHMSEQSNENSVTMQTAVTTALAGLRDTAQSGAVHGLSTGFPEMDEHLYGLEPGKLIIVAGRPGMGKTTLVMNFVDHVAQHHADRGVPLVFSLEMPSEELALRSISAIGGINSRNLKRGSLTELESRLLPEVAERVRSLPVLFEDDGGYSVEDVVMITMRENARRKISMVVIDYLQIMQESAAISGRNRSEALGHITMQLKRLAKKLKIPVILLSQLNRDLEKRQDKRPNMGDLRESGAIEQDADIILFCYRDEVYYKDSRDKGMAEIIVGKFRGGDPDKVFRLLFQGQYYRFRPKPVEAVDAFAPPPAKFAREDAPDHF